MKSGQPYSGMYTEFKRGKKIDNRRKSQESRGKIKNISALVAKKIVRIIFCENLRDLREIKYR